MFQVYSLGPSVWASVASVYAVLLGRPDSSLVTSLVCPRGSSSVVKLRFQWWSREVKKLYGPLVCNLRVFRFTW
ncbi:hypothetical protein Bca4012_007770 [Brassica carinata]